jgi:hypothetical protein
MNSLFIGVKDGSRIILRKDFVLTENGCYNSQFNLLNKILYNRTNTNMLYYHLESLLSETEIAQKKILQKFYKEVQNVNHVQFNYDDYAIRYAHGTLTNDEKSFLSRIILLNSIRQKCLYMLRPSVMYTKYNIKSSERINIDGMRVVDALMILEQEVPKIIKFNVKRLAFIGNCGVSRSKWEIYNTIKRNTQIYELLSTMRMVSTGEISLKEYHRIVRRIEFINVSVKDINGEIYVNFKKIQSLSSLPKYVNSCLDLSLIHLMIAIRRIEVPKI